MSIFAKIMSSLSKYVIVNLNGEVYFNIDKIISLLNNAHLFTYGCINTNSLINPKYYNRSFLYHNLLDLISNGISLDGVWWSNTYNKNNYNLCLDTLYFDEFQALLIEDCLKFDSVELHRSEEISLEIDYRGIEYTKEEIDWLFLEACTEDFPTNRHVCFYELMVDDVDLLRKNYKKLVFKYHPNFRISESLAIFYENLYPAYKRRRQLLQ